MSDDPGTQLYLDEACYYLSKEGYPITDISEKISKTQAEVKKSIKRHKSRIKNSEVQEENGDRSFWLDLVMESKGDVKVTFARKDGFYHCRRSDLENMNSDALMEIFELSKQCLDFDPSYRFGFLEKKPPVGFDHLALSREIKNTVALIEKILYERENTKSNSTSSNKSQDK